MKVRNIIFICLGALAFVAVVVALCLFFFAKKSVEDVPSSLQVAKVEDEYFLVAEYNEQYTYRFRLEQNIDGEFILIDTVDSESNQISLSIQNFNIVTGGVYRFSACYVRENMSGEWSETYVWQPDLILDAVESSSIVFDEEELNLSWQNVENADSYTILFVDENGDSFSLECSTNEISLQEVIYGKYLVYVVANSENGWLSSSSDGVEIVVEKQNEIISATIDENLTLTITCTLKPSYFEVYVDGILKGTLSGGTYNIVDGQYVFVLAKAKILLYYVDLENSSVQIKSCTDGYLLESDMFEI